MEIKSVVEDIPGPNQVDDPYADPRAAGLACMGF